MGLQPAFYTIRLNLTFMIGLIPILDVIFGLSLICIERPMERDFIHDHQFLTHFYNHRYDLLLKFTKSKIQIIPEFQNIASCLSNQKHLASII